MNSVRATAYAERRGTPQTWANRVGAQVAINADFFDFPGWSLVNGRARGDGEDWPNQFHEARSYWQFGLFNAGLVEDANIPPPATPWALDIVGGHNILIRDGVGQGPSFDGDAVIVTAHRRTAVGLSKDKRTLFLFATDHSIDGNGMIGELVPMQQEAGAPPIWWATNMDGGGSSQLYVAGYGQIITSGRQVNNHLGVIATGSGAGGNCNDLFPRGTLDGASCNGASGWAQDLNSPDAPISAHVYFGGPAGVGVGVALKADQRRDDLCIALKSCNHGFSTRAPSSFFDGQPHPVHAYGIDLEGVSNPELGNSPLTLTCSASTPLPAGVRRHITAPAAFNAWGFNAFWDMRTVADATFNALPQGTNWPSTPDMVRTAGDPSIWVLDNGWRRHIFDLNVAAAWHLDLSKARSVSATTIASWPVGPPLRKTPLLVRASGPAFDVLDDDVQPPVVDAGSGGGSGGAAGGSGGGAGGAGGGGEDLDAGAWDAGEGGADDGGIAGFGGGGTEGSGGGVVDASGPLGPVTAGCSHTLGPPWWFAALLAALGHARTRRTRGR